jgi:hypothetical protein
MFITQRAREVIIVLHQNDSYGSWTYGLNVTLRTGYTILMGNLLECDHVEDVAGSGCVGIVETGVEEVNWNKLPEDRFQ